MSYSGITLVDGKLTTQDELNKRLLKEIKALKSANGKLKKSKINKTGLNVNIQLLVIKYLNLLDKIEEGEKLKIDNINKSKLLSVIINSGSENIRRFLSNPQYGISNNAKRKNLNYVITLFKSLNLNEAAKLARKDLQKLPPTVN